MSKRKLTSRACDSCRTRRIRCIVPEETGKTAQPCKACDEASLRCTFEVLPRRRGPPAKARNVLFHLPNHKNIYDLPRALNAFCGRPIVDHLVQGFLDHLYPLMPVVHIPSFLEDLRNDRHMSDVPFSSLLVAMLATTACVLPEKIHECKDIDGPFPHATRKEMLEAAERLIVLIRPPDYFDIPTHDKWACAYLLAVATAQMELMQRCIMYQSQATTILREMQLYNVDNYRHLDQIEQQLAKKAVWIDFMTECHINLHFMRHDHLHIERSHVRIGADLLFPLEVDDEFITKEEVMPQPYDRLSLVAGLNAMSTINKNLTDTTLGPPVASISCHESEEAVLPSTTSKWLGVCACGREVRRAPLIAAVERLSKLERCLDYLPRELSFEGPMRTPGQDLPRLDSLQSQYETTRANIHITHAWAQNLLVEQILSLTDHLPRDSQEGPSIKANCIRAQQRLARQLLAILDTLPKITLLPNGPVLILKIRSVGASVLDFANTHECSGSSEVARRFAAALADLDSQREEDRR